MEIAASLALLREGQAIRLYAAGSCGGRMNGRRIAPFAGTSRLASPRPTRVVVV